MNIKLHTPKSLKAGSGMASLKQLVPAVALRNQRIHCAHVWHGRHHRLQCEAEGKTRDCDDGDVRYVQLVAVDRKS